jgi:hypothetical protein
MSQEPAVPRLSRLSLLDVPLAPPTANREPPIAIAWADQ